MLAVVVPDVLGVEPVGLATALGQFLFGFLIAAISISVVVYAVYQGVMLLMQYIPGNDEYAGRLARKYGMEREDFYTERQMRRKGGY